jgi:hypothetical protein
MLGDTVKPLGSPKHVERYSLTLGVPKTCWEITVKCLGLPKHVGRYGKTIEFQNMLGDTVECLGLPKHVGRYSRMLGAPKTCWEIL